nr:uncharacterized protein C24B11.05 [Ipomoea trifida]
MKVLDRIGIKDCFERIIYFETMNPNLSRSSWSDEFPLVLKPAMEAMNIAVDFAYIDPHRTIRFSVLINHLSTYDSFRNPTSSTLSFAIRNG